MKLSYQQRREVQRNAHLIRNERGDYVNAREIQAMLNLPAKLPATAAGPVWVQGIRVWVTAAAPTHGTPGARKTSTQRVLCNCPYCGTAVPVGRLAQHVIVHKHVIVAA